MYFIGFLSCFIVSFFVCFFLFSVLKSALRIHNLPKHIIPTLWKPLVAFNVIDPSIQFLNLHFFSLHASLCCWLQDEAPVSLFILLNVSSTHCETKRASSIKREDRLPQQPRHEPNCKFITDAADQYSTLDSTQCTMIQSLCWWKLFTTDGDVMLPRVLERGEGETAGAATFPPSSYLPSNNLAFCRKEPNVRTKTSRSCCVLCFPVTSVLWRRPPCELARCWEKSAPLHLWGLTETHISPRLLSGTGSV